MYTTVGVGSQIPVKLVGRTGNSGLGLPVNVKDHFFNIALVNNLGNNGNGGIAPKRGTIRRIQHLHHGCQGIGSAALADAYNDPFGIANIPAFIHRQCPHVMVAVVGNTAGIPQIFQFISGLAFYFRVVDVQVNGGNFIVVRSGNNHI